jgi:hypothetical protein
MTLLDQETLIVMRRLLSRKHDLQSDFGSGGIDLPGP